MDDQERKEVVEEVEEAEELTEDMIVEVSGGVRAMLDPDG